MFIPILIDSLAIVAAFAQLRAVTVELSFLTLVVKAAMAVIGAAFPHVVRPFKLESKSIGKFTHVQFRASRFCPCY